MTLLLDMNISPKLVELLLMRQVKAMHWINVGKSDATDMEIMEYAKKNDCIMVTYDLDFSTMLSITQAKKPSVIQIRKQGMELLSLAELLTSSVQLWESELENGVILTLDAKRGRVRLLPLINL